MNRLEVEMKLNDGRNWLLTCFRGLTEEQLHRPITPSEHDPINLLRQRVRYGFLRISSAAALIAMMPVRIVGPGTGANSGE